MKIGTIYDITFSTNRADTGALANADSTPVVRVTEDGVNLAYLPTVSSLSTGVYLVSINTSAGNGFEVGKRYSVYATATVNAINGAIGLDSFTMETQGIDDVLPTTSYTAPDNATISAIQTEVNSHPTLAEMEASTVLAQVADIPTVGQIRTELSPELALINLNLDAKVSSVSGGGGLTTEEHDKLMGITGGGGISISTQSIQTSISNAKREILEKVEQIPQVSLEKVESQLEEIVTTVNENKSQNDIANANIIDRIKEAEIDLRKDVKDTKKELREDNVKTRNLVRQKSEKVVKYAEKQLYTQDKLEQMIEDEAEEIEKVLEQNIEFEADDIENQINSQIDKEIEEIESNLPNNGNNNGTEG